MRNQLTKRQKVVGMFLTFLMGLVLIYHEWVAGVLVAVIIYSDLLVISSR